jgi:hypothetical protein
MSSRTVRWTARIGVAAVAVALAAPAAWAAVAWSPAPTAAKAKGAVSPNGSWNYGSSLARTTGNKIAIEYTGAKPKPQGAYVNIGTVNATTKAVTWGTPARVSQAALFADRTSLAGGGNNFYAGFVTQSNATASNPAKPRVSYVSTSVNGAAFGAPVRVSPAKGRVDYPIVAAKGNNVYVVYTNDDTGEVQVRESTNAGVTFPKTKSLGFTTRNDTEGTAAWPIDCAAPDSNNVGVVWLPGDGTIKLSVSTNNGGAFTTSTIPAVNAGTDGGWASCDAVGNRIGVTWNQDDGVYYAEYNTVTSTLSTPTVAYALPDAGNAHLASYGDTVSLTGGSKVGIAAPLCVQDGCDLTLQSNSSDLNWLESSNNGGSFAAPQLIASGSVTGKHFNDSPSAMYYNDSTRFVLYNGWDANYTNYRLYLSTGKG